MKKTPWGEIEVQTVDPERPTVVCLCGSTRFSMAFRVANFILTLRGKIVLTIGCDTKSDAGLKLTEEDKRQLDELHLRKIDLADEILVLNVDGYVGESTSREIEYADTKGRIIRFLTSDQEIIEAIEINESKTNDEF